MNSLPTASAVGTVLEQHGMPKEQFDLRLPGHDSSGIGGTPEVRHMPLPKLSLQVLEAFEHVARSGSMQKAAHEMGMSISSVSHHVARLEEALGVTLLNRSSRPSVLTRAGREALHHLSSGLDHLRRATSETAISGLLGMRSLRIGIVEDLESNVTPDLAVALAGRMPNAALSISNVLSHEAPGLLLNGRLDLAIAAEVQDHPSEIRAEPILRDPFVIATPRESSASTADLMQGDQDVPFLRFNQSHLIGKQIDAHLSRNRIALADRFSFDSVQSIMAVVANGDGWSVLTPLGFIRAQRYAARVTLRPFPRASFARRILLMARNEFDPSTSEAIAALVRDSLRRLATNRVTASHPWLATSFVVLGPDG
ncbi:MAG: LysR family transcriptional regulator [Pseudomonadota bacterium]